MYLTILLLKMYKPKKLVEKQQLNRTLTTSEQIALFNYVLVFFKHTFFKHNILNTRSFGLTRYLKRLCVWACICVWCREGEGVHTHTHILHFYFATLYSDEETLVMATRERINWKQIMTNNFWENSWER